MENQKTYKHQFEIKNLLIKYADKKDRVIAHAGFIDKDEIVKKIDNPHQNTIVENYLIQKSRDVGNNK